ncbi:hypothetical protein VKT23_008592 [Stygiomarasmius scandens]|uniref:Uncharacterized protein n=1 Tax=Marasmiellus scandens TaxID=2682957 RepID=A0ABR1JJE8_9AGAR
MCETGLELTKDSFAAIYGRAHLAALTPELVRTAFQKTGLWLLDPSVITDDMMAPSRDTSWKIYMPVEPSTPVRIMTDLLIDTVHNVPPPPPPPATWEPDSPSLNLAVTSQHSPSSNHRRQVCFAIPKLKSTSAGYLVTTSPIKGSMEPPKIPTYVMLPMQKPQGGLLELLSLQPKTSNECRLQEALRTQVTRANSYKKQVLILQASAVLQRAYCSSMRKQLLLKEEKEKKRQQKFFGDGRAKILTSDEFFERVVEHDKEMEEKDRERTRKAAKERQAVELIQWEKEEKERKDWNEAKDEARKAALENWNAQRAAAKARKVKLKDWDKQNPKPSTKDLKYAPEPAIPRPKIKQTSLPIPSADNGNEDITWDEEEWTDDDENDSDRPV